MNKVFSIAFISFVFQFGCGTGKSKSEIEIKIEKEICSKCKFNKDCSIDISSITPFKWDRIFVFKETATLDEIQSAIDADYPYFTDIARRLLFLNAGKIVYHEEIFPNVESIIDGQVIFDMPDSVNYASFFPQKFTVKKLNFDKGVYYVLSQ